MNAPEKAQAAGDVKEPVLHAYFQREPNLAPRDERTRLNSTKSSETSLKNGESGSNTST